MVTLSAPSISSVSQGEELLMEAAQEWLRQTLIDENDEHRTLFLSMIMFP